MTARTTRINSSPTASNRGAPFSRSATINSSTASSRGGAPPFSRSATLSSTTTSSGRGAPPPFSRSGTFSGGSLKSSRQDSINSRDSFLGLFNKSTTTTNNSQISFDEQIANCSVRPRNSTQIAAWDLFGMDDLDMSHLSEHYHHDHVHKTPASLLLDFSASSNHSMMSNNSGTLNHARRQPTQNARRRSSAPTVSSTALLMAAADTDDFTEEGEREGQVLEDQVQPRSPVASFFHQRLSTFRNNIGSLGERLEEQSNKRIGTFSRNIDTIGERLEEQSHKRINTFTKNIDTILSDFQQPASPPVSPKRATERLTTRQLLQKELQEDNEQPEFKETKPTPLSISTTSRTGSSTNKKKKNRGQPKSNNQNRGVPRTASGTANALFMTWSRNMDAIAERWRESTNAPRPSSTSSTTTTTTTQAR